MYQGIAQILFSLFAVVYLCPNINAVRNGKLCFLRVPLVYVCVLNCHGEVSGDALHFHQKNAF